MALTLLALGFFFIILAVGASLITIGFDKLVKHLDGRMKLAVASIFVALSTSLPELSVAILSAVEGRPNVSLSNLLGANVANLSFVVGGTTLLSGALAIVGNYWRFEMGAAFLAGLAPIALMLDGSLTRFDGVILLVIYIIYLDELVIDGKKKNLAKESVATPLIVRLRRMKENGEGRALLKLFFGLILVGFSADRVVALAVELARSLAVPIPVVGFLVVALGTTLPELAVSIRAAFEKNVALVLGNLLGSVVTNSTLIVGLLAILSPFRVAAVRNFGLNNIAFVVIFGLFWFFTTTRRSLSRFEGLILLGIFLCFAGLQLFLGAV